MSHISTGQVRSNYHHYLGSLMLAGAIIVAGSTAVATGTSAATSRSAAACHSANGVKITDSEACKGLAFYQGKTVTFIAPTTAGSAFDITSRAMAREMSTYLGATINVEDVAGATGITGMDALAATPANGLTIGYYNLSSEMGFLVTNAPAVNFNIKSISLFGGETNSVQILVTQSTSPYTSFAELKASDSSANPVRIVELTGLSGLAGILTMREFGLPATYLTGYSGSAASTTGFIRGDGPLYATGPGNVASYIEGGTVRVLALETQSLTLNPSAPLFSILSKTPTDGALEKKYPPRTNGEKAAARFNSLITSATELAFGGPPGMPSYLVSTLRDAVKWAALTTYVKTQIIALGNPVGYLYPSAVKANLDGVVARAPQIEKFLGY